MTRPLDAEIARSSADGIVELGTPEADALGFTRADWNAASYLWRDGGEVYCSALIANEPGKGAFRRLVASIEAAGLTVAVPTPLGRMESILQRWGWTPMIEGAHGDGTDVWRKAALSATGGRGEK